MKARNSLLRLKAFQVKEKKRQLQQLQLMMDEFGRMSDELHAADRVRKKSGQASPIPTHFAYSTFAKSARQRAENLAVSVADLRQQRSSAEAELAEMEADYERAAALEERDGANRKRA